MVEFLILSLAVWRITALLVYDKIAQPLRDLAKVEFLDETDTPITFWGRILSCFWCTSIVVAFVILPLTFWRLWKWALLPFAASGAAILLNHWTRIVRDVRY